nr:DUF1836 domain-containing protein [Ectobacillus ponti]
MRELDVDSQLELEDIPNLDLYMDQVIQLFENKFKDAKRTGEEKILTKTMINNYAKGKLFFPIRNKKYTKEHLILISLIYQLKGALSINDIKALLSPMNEKVTENEIDLEEVYGGYLQLAAQNAAAFKEDLQVRAAAAEQQQLPEVLLTASLVHMSNLYRRAAEKLVDRLEQK